MITAEIERDSLSLSLSYLLSRGVQDLDRPGLLYEGRRYSNATAERSSSRACKLSAASGEERERDRQALGTSSRLQPPPRAERDRVRERIGARLRARRGIIVFRCFSPAGYQLPETSCQSSIGLAYIGARYSIRSGPMADLTVAILVSPPPVPPRDVKEGDRNTRRQKKDVAQFRSHAERSSRATLAQLLE